MQAAIIGADSGLEPLIAMGLGFDAALINEAALAFAREYISIAYGVGLANAISGHTKEVVQREVAKWFEAGDKLDELIGALEPTFGRKRAETIAITEVTNAISGGNIAAWKEANRQLGAELVTGSRWTTANDENVCPVCAPLGGLTFIDGESNPSPIDTQQKRGVTAGLSDVFVHPGGPGVLDKFKGKTFYRPPAHARCRCSLSPLTAEVPKQ